jgi:transposase
LVCPTLASTQKKCLREGRIIVFVDEAAFYLLAGVVRTYAPRGQTPVLRVPLTRDHLSVISGITRAGELLTGMQERAFKGADLVGLLKHLLAQLGGKLMVIWDGLPAHQEQAVKQFLAEAGGVLCIEQLPGYAPDLNPDEGVWHYLKHVELRNVACHDFDELSCQLRLAIARLRHKPNLIRSFFKQYGY